MVATIVLVSRMNIPWLIVVLAVPLGASLLLQLGPRSATTLLKAFTVAATAATAVIVGVLVAGMSGTAQSPGPLSFHYQEFHSWIPAISAGYHLGLDGISAWTLALNAGVFVSRRRARPTAQHRPSQTVLWAPAADRDHDRQRPAQPRPAALLHVLGGDADPALLHACQLR